jgi:hypothetical protein
MRLFSPRAVRIVFKTNGRALCTMVRLQLYLISCIAIRNINETNVMSFYHIVQLYNEIKRPISFSCHWHFNQSKTF